MQTLPTFVYLIPTLVLFGLGVVPGLISTVIFALPAPIRLTHLGISSVPRPLLEAGDAFGATPLQRLWKIELPSARAHDPRRRHAVHHAVAVDGRDRGAGRRRRPRRAGRPRAEQRAGRRRVRGRVCDRAARDHARSHQPAARSRSVADERGARVPGRRHPVQRASRAARTRARSATALARLDAGATREEISAACGVVVGVAGASLAHRSRARSA